MISQVGVLVFCLPFPLTCGILERSSLCAGVQDGKLAADAVNSLSKLIESTLAQWDSGKEWQGFVLSVAYFGSHTCLGTCVTCDCEVLIGEVFNELLPCPCVFCRCLVSCCRRRTRIRLRRASGTTWGGQCAECGGHSVGYGRFATCNDFFTTHFHAMRWVHTPFVLSHALFAPEACVVSVLKDMCSGLAGNLTVPNAYPTLRDKISITRSYNPTEGRFVYSLAKL